MILAYVTLGLWFVVAIVLFMTLRPSLAATATLIAGAMFLPERVGIDLPALPELAKDQVTVLACLVGCLIFAFPELRRARLGRGPESAMVVLVAGTVITVLLNRDPVVSGATLISGTRATDFLSDSLGNLILWGIPFFLGRALVTRSRDLRGFFVAFVLAGLVYTLFILVELRLSPQFHRWTYGFHQHGFSQTIRESGYRPMVFMRHGLHLALFIFLAMTAAMTMARARLSLFGLSTAGLSVYLAAILVLCKSLGALVYGLVTAPLVLLASPRMQIRLALAIACVIIAYPVLRAVDLVPLESVREFAEAAAGPARARSMVGRMETETEVMELANARPLFGWASASRTMTYHETRPGESLTVYDGSWLILYSRGGIVRLGSILVLLLYPVFAAARSLPRIRNRVDRSLVSGLALMVCINVFDMLPNSTTEPYLTLMSGVLAGIVPGLLREQRRSAPRPNEAPGLRVRPGSGLGDGLLGGGAGGGTRG